MSDCLDLDGSYGEGGGQILRAALALSALTRRPFHLHSIRARRRNPGLRPQHLAAVQAMAAVCLARLEGDQLDSRALTFEPTTAPQPGHYVVDVAKVAARGSAGSVTLLFQALCLPLAFCDGPSSLTLRGGTHVAWSPPYHYLAGVYWPMMERLGYRGSLELVRWGWFPSGGGEIAARIEGLSANASRALRPLMLEEQGRLEDVRVISAISNLPQHVLERQGDRALQRLRSRHIKARVEPVVAKAPSPGTMLFLLARDETHVAGFTGYGRLRYPAERVADDAAKGFAAHQRSKAALDPHLADQLLLPLAVTPGASRYTTSRVTQHLVTLCWLAQQFLEREMTIEGSEGQPGRIVVSPDWPGLGEEG